MDAQVTPIGCLGIAIDKFLTIMIISIKNVQYAAQAVLLLGLSGPLTSLFQRFT